MRYKGVKIPTYEEALNDMKLNKTDEDAQLAPNLVVQVREVNIIVCSLEEAENIKQMDGVNGINKKIEDVCKDYIDNIMDGALTMIDSVRDMEDDVNDPNNNKVFKDLSSNLPFKDVEVEVKDLEPKKESSNILTDEQVDQINKLAEEANKNNPEIQKIQSMPSNNGVEERKPEDVEESGEMKLMDVSVDPNTGEHKILGDHSDSDDVDNETFEEFYDRISNSDIDFDQNKEITEKEAEEIENMDKTKLFSTISDESDLDNLDAESIRALISIANRKINKENFSVYNAMPDKVKAMIDKYAIESGISTLDKRYREFKHSVADMLMDDFIGNINMNRIQKDFNSEVESMFDKASKEIGAEIVGYSEQKIQKYREAAEKMEDPEKKQKLLGVLDRIDEAYNLSELKEFAKSCKIKKFDLEKPSKLFDAYTRKYAESTYNAYSIEMARPILYRNLNTGDDEQFSDKDINAFFIAFCKQTRNMRSDNVLDHSYMYYVMYNIVLADLNKSDETKHVSEKFLDNVKEVIKNLRDRNQGVM